MPNKVLEGTEVESIPNDVKNVFTVQSLFDYHYPILKKGLEEYLSTRTEKLYFASVWFGYQGKYCILVLGDNLEKDFDLGGRNTWVVSYYNHPLFENGNHELEYLIFDLSVENGKPNEEVIEELDFLKHYYDYDLVDTVYVEDSLYYGDGYVHLTKRLTEALVEDIPANLKTDDFLYFISGEEFYAQNSFYLKLTVPGKRIEDIRKGLLGKYYFIEDESEE